MSALPPGVERRDVEGEHRLTTPGMPVYGEPTVDGRRVWDAHRSKLAAMLEREMSVRFDGESRVLYLGAGAGTTVSHLADVCRVVYAVEFAPRAMRELLSVAADRAGVVPLLTDARAPETYGHVVESDCDLLVQDVATRGQAAVALENRRFLADDGQLALAIKARSEDVTADPAATFDRVLDELAGTYRVEATADLAPFHADHLGVVASPR
ncbi:MAG: fibrillarin-like rRNA/tRNA 2'-O-methyltransferase [Halobacteriales archaeon]